MEVQNAQALEVKPRPDGKRVVRVFALVHRDGDLDGLAVAHLGLKSSIVFGALNLADHPIFGLRGNPLGKHIANSLSRHDNFILLGDKNREAPIDKLVRLLRAEKSDNVVIFPEGHVSLGLMEGRPVSDKFTDSLLLRLGNEGFAYEVIPVTLLNSGRLLHYSSELGGLALEGGERTLRIKIHDAIPGDEVKKLSTAASPQAFNRLLRQLWLESLPTDTGHLMGQARWRATLDKLGVAIPSMSPGRSESPRAAVLSSAAERAAARIDAVRASTGPVFLSTFRLAPDPTTFALLGEMMAKARAGHPVRILLDEAGLTKPDWSIPPQYLMALTEAGVEIRVFSPNERSQKFASRELHAKVLVTDQVAIVGSGSTTGGSLAMHKPTNQEIDALVMGPAVGDAHAFVHGLWNSEHVRPLTELLDAASVDFVARSAATEVLEQGRYWVRDIGLVNPEQPMDLEDVPSCCLVQHAPLSATPV